jgi:hypothetical protein
MRFLLEMLRQKRRSLTIENLLLLLMRMLALACLAFALTRPNLHLPGGLADKDVVERSGKTAAVLLIDDGLSSAAGRTGPRWTRSRPSPSPTSTRSRPAMRSASSPNRARCAPADPLYDLSRRARSGRRPAAERGRQRRAGAARGRHQPARRHLNPEAEVVLCSDGRGDGWHAEDRVRWEELRRRSLASRMPCRDRASGRIWCCSPPRRMRSIAMSRSPASRSTAR